MEIKGTAVKSIKDFVLKNYPNRYNEWFDSLPATSREIMIESIISANWYSLNDAAIEPTKKIGEIFFENNLRKGAWECGRFSAETALTGIYKIYVKFSSPNHIIQRASRILPAYYSSSEIEVTESGDKYVNLKMFNIEKPTVIIEYRIAGWMERALEISGCENVKIEIPKSLTRGDQFTTFNCSWS